MYQDVSSALFLIAIAISTGDQSSKLWLIHNLNQYGWFYGIPLRESCKYICANIERSLPLKRCGAEWIMPVNRKCYNRYKKLLTSILQGVELGGFGVR